MKGEYQLLKPRQVPAQLLSNIATEEQEGCYGDGIPLLLWILLMHCSTGRDNAKYPTPISTEALDELEYIFQLIMLAIEERCTQGKCTKEDAKQFIQDSLDIRKYSKRKKINSGLFQVHPHIPNKVSFQTELFAQPMIEYIHIHWEVSVLY
jgi:hypothetical protein